MGMDVKGRFPFSEAGSYFYINMSDWNKILSLTCEVCPGLLDHELIESMRSHDGAGPDDRETCLAMAERLEVWWRKKVDGVILEKSEIRELSNLRLLDWIAFLRDCNGFRVD